MSNYHAIRQFKNSNNFKSGDVLVLFGELFNRGYANGLVEEAQKRGMTIVRSTVGRRDKDNSLRALNVEETANIPQPFINIPLEAGFDFENVLDGKSIIDSIKDVKLSEWENIRLDFDIVEKAAAAGRNRFKSYLQKYLVELDKLVPTGANVYFAHLMAGGVPKAKIILPLMNRSLKGTGDRFLSSEKFWNSDLGKLCSVSFNEVTAETFRMLIEESANLRKKIESNGGNVSYSGYGYHGTEVLLERKYCWQSYSPYLQGWAKLKLENYSRKFNAEGINCCVYNCPEILTNSSAIFSGVEVCFYPLLAAIHHEGKGKAHIDEYIKKLVTTLKPECSLETIENFTKRYLSKPEIKQKNIFEQWPEHNSKEQLETMLTAAEEIFNFHLTPGQALTTPLSEVVIKATGKIMLNDVTKPEAAVAWINHDVIAKMASTFEEIVH